MKHHDDFLNHTSMINQIHGTLIPQIACGKRGFSRIFICDYPRCEASAFIRVQKTNA
jgi:hypothetical protein